MSISFFLLETISAIPSLRISPIHQSEKKMDLDKEKDANSEDPITLYKRTGKIRRLNGSSNVGSSLDIVC